MLLATHSHADPLPGQMLKFDQITDDQHGRYGGSNTYYGHDELSTAYGVGNAASPPVNYRGEFMADDFADTFPTPVVHITWWGSYLNDMRHLTAATGAEVSHRMGNRRGGRSTWE